MRTLTLLTILSTGLAAQTPPRPKILRIAHVSLFVHDVNAARVFYKDLLGFGEPFKLDNPDGSLSMTFIKVNDRQYIELSPEKTPETDRLNHIAVEVDNAETMRAFLAAHAIKVPATVPKGRSGNSNFMITDPDGHRVEIVQYEPTGWSMLADGKFIDGPRLSKRIRHLGISVGQLGPSVEFYSKLLGFVETWRGSKNGQVLDWVNLRVPDGDDYLELMLYDKPPSLAALHTAHHICLEVDDLAKAQSELEQRPAFKTYTRPLEPKVGVNHKRQLNLFDPDGTRSELMEWRTFDGKPVPPATAPPPHP